MKLWFLSSICLWGLTSQLAFAEDPSKPHFSRSCSLFSQPSVRSAIVCQRRRGSTITGPVKSAGGGFWYVETDGCRGYAVPSCLGGLTGANTNKEAPRDRQKPGRERESREVRENKYPHSYSTSDPLRLSVFAHLDGPFGRTASSGTLSRGLGAGLGVLLKLPLANQIRVDFGPSFQLLRLGRKIDGSGALTDPNPSDFNQSIKYLGGTALFTYVVEPHESAAPYDVEWAINAGLQFLYPLSGTQTDPINGELKISPDKILLALAGPAINLNVNDWNLNGALHLFYNVSSVSPPTFFGLRLSVAVDFNLG